MPVAVETGRTIRVLLVEDDPLEAKLVDIYLREAVSPRFELTHVDRVSRALAALEATPFDVVLLDLGLPDAFGFSAVDALAGAHPRVIVVSGVGDQNRAALIERGAAACLQKGGFDEHTLPRRILDALGAG